MWKVRLTQEGSQLWQRAARIDRAARRRIRAELTETELDTLDSLLTRVRENLEGVPESS